jgi:hypothetical protein
MESNDNNMNKRKEKNLLIAKIMSSWRKLASCRNEANIDKKKL